MNLDDTHAQVGALLRRNDQRYTSRRVQLVEILFAADGPVTIQQILDSDQSLAQSSAYRNLLVLEESNVVSRVVTGTEFAGYELSETFTGHHHHLICSRCGDVADFSLSSAAEVALERKLQSAANEAQFTVESHRLDLMGTCGSCT